MSCYFDSYFLPGKQTGVLGPGPGRRPEGKGRDLPLLTRAPCRKQELSRSLSCSTVALHPTARPPVFTRGREEGGGSMDLWPVPSANPALATPPSPASLVPSVKWEHQHHGSAAKPSTPHWTHGSLVFAVILILVKTQRAVAQGQEPPGGCAAGR